MSQSWGYSEEDGPATWADKFPEAAGNRQSPVNIDTSIVIAGRRSLKHSPLSWSYNPASVSSIVNSGHGWKVNVDGSGCEVIGGPVKEPHKLVQFHCHWGPTSDQGSEHTVDGTPFAAELHLVHWNSSKYATVAEASAKSDGLVVLGVLLKVGEAHPEIEKIANLISEIPHKGQSVPIHYPIDIAKLLPNSRCYWSYPGSLTTPPCSEVVTWVLFKEPIEVSEEQLEAFRSMRCYEEGEDCPRNELNGHIINNFRPPVDLGDRILCEFIF